MADIYQPTVQLNKIWLFGVFLCAMDGIEIFFVFCCEAGQEMHFFRLFSALGPCLIFLLILIAIKFIANATP